MIIAIIQARMSSTRLPGKVLMSIMNKPILQHVVERVRASILINRIIVATTTEVEDDKIEEFCLNNQVIFFRGSKDDVLDRFYKAAYIQGLKDEDVVVRITADCPLHDAKIIDKVIDVYLHNNYDYVSNTLEYTYPDGTDVEVFSFKSLKQSWINAKLISEREHVTPYIKANEEFAKLNIKADKLYPNYRLTLDCPEDFELIRAIYQGIGKEKFSLDEIIEFMDKNPKLTEVNNMYDINEGYKKSLATDKLVNT